eukprot:164612-Chlamydomonas_euryale.AAC.3
MRPMLCRVPGIGCMQCVASAACNAWHRLHAMRGTGCMQCVASAMQCVAPAVATHPFIHPSSVMATHAHARPRTRTCTHAHTQCAFILLSVACRPDIPSVYRSR